LSIFLANLQYSTAKCRQHRQLEFTLMAKNLLLLNGPKLNLLGTREPEVYGSTTLADIEQAAKAQATVAGATITPFQSNYEGTLHYVARLPKSRFHLRKYLSSIFTVAKHSITSLSFPMSLSSAAWTPTDILLPSIAR
jgi:3-dehydroquinate dehydratase